MCATGRESSGNIGQRQCSGHHSIAASPTVDQLFFPNQAVCIVSRLLIFSFACPESACLVGVAGRQQGLGRSGLASLSELGRSDKAQRMSLLGGN